MERDTSIHNGFSVVFISFFLSTAINSGIFFSLDKSLSIHSPVWARKNKEINSPKKKDPMQFEFVEAPPLKLAEKPKNTKRVAAYDARNQDVVQNPRGLENSPRMKVRGPADQLAQKRGKPGSEPAPEVKPVTPVSGEQQTPKEAQRENEKQMGAGKDEIVLPSKQSVQKKNSVKEVPGQSASLPKPAVKGLTGHDKITTQAMSRRPSPGTKSFGITAFEATGSGLGEYMKKLKEKVWLAWFPYLAFQYPSDFRGADAVIGITLDARGDVKMVRVLESHGSGIFASYCMEAIQRASNFGSVPKEILALTGKEEIEIKFGFHYG